MPDLTLPRVPPVLWCAIALLLCLSAVAARVIWRAEPLLDSLQPTRVPVTAADRAHALQRLGPFEDVQFTTADGVTLRGWYKPARNGAAVIFVHGGGNNRLWFLPEAAALVRSGFGVLLFDSRANGESAGALQSWGDHEPADARAAVDFVAARPDVIRGRIGMDGFSIGASTVALVAALDERVQAVVLSAMWPSLDEELQHKAAFPKPLSLAWLRWRFAAAGVRTENVRPAARLPAIAPRALALVAGDQDSDTPLDVMRGNVAASGNHADLWVITGAGHDHFDVPGGDAYLRRLSAFFVTALLAPR